MEEKDSQDKLQDSIDNNIIIQNGQSNSSNISILFDKRENLVALYIDKNYYFNPPNEEESFSERDEARKYFEELKSEYGLN